MVVFRIGDRVRFSKTFLHTIAAPPSDPAWRLFGVVVGFQPPRHIRVKFDQEETPRTVPEVNLSRP